MRRFPETLKPSVRCVALEPLLFASFLLVLIQATRRWHYVCRAPLSLCHFVPTGSVAAWILTPPLNPAQPCRGRIMGVTSNTQSSI